MSSNVIYLIVLWISYLNPQLLLVEHLESLLLSVLVSALQTGMIDVELQCTLDTVSQSRGYSQIYSINKFSTNKPGRSFSRTGPNVRLRVWFMFGLRIWALTTSNKAWHMCWSLFLSSSVVFWPVPDSTKNVLCSETVQRVYQSLGGVLGLEINVPGAICWRTFSHLNRIWRVTWWFPKIISRSDFIFVISCLNRVISCVFCEFGLRFASCSLFAII